MQITRNILPFPAMWIYEPGPYQLCCLPLRQVMVMQQLNITLSNGIIKSLPNQAQGKQITCIQIHSIINITSTLFNFQMTLPFFRPFLVLM